MHSDLPQDSVCIRGLSILLEEEGDVPFVDLQLDHGECRFRAAILAAEGEWMLRLTDEGGEPLPGNGELYLTQHGAVFAALLSVLGECQPDEGY